MLPLTEPSTKGIADSIHRVKLTENGQDGSPTESVGSRANTDDFVMAPETQPVNTFLPSFLEMDDNEGEDKTASRHQLNELRQFECDENDAACTDRLTKGLRPGDFMKTFVKLSWVDKIQSRPDCAAFLTDLSRWMDRMSNADKSQTLVPEAVK